MARKHGISMWSWVLPVVKRQAGQEFSSINLKTGVGQLFPKSTTWIQFGSCGLLLYTTTLLSNVFSIFEQEEGDASSIFEVSRIAAICSTIYFIQQTQEGKLLVHNSFGEAGTAK